MNSLIIIAGPSGSGKSLLASGLSALTGYRVINQDNFCLDRSHLLKNSRFYDLDHEVPGIVDHDLAFSVLDKLLKGSSANVPNYVHKTLSSDGETLVEGGSLIYEGLHTLYDDRIRDLAMLKIFLDCDYTTLKSRRLKRDEEERLILDPEAENYFDRRVMPGYVKHVEPLRAQADCVLDATLAADDLVTSALRHYSLKTEERIKF